MWYFITKASQLEVTDVNQFFDFYFQELYFSTAAIAELQVGHRSIQFKCPSLVR